MSEQIRSVIDPAEFDMSAALHQKLTFFISESPPLVYPGGERQLMSRGNVVTYYPGTIEQSFKQGPNPEWYLVEYCFQVTEVDGLIAYCVDNLVDGLHQMLRNRDYGARLAELIAKEWPTTMTLLQSGHLWDFSAPALMKVITSEPQWVVAGMFTRQADTDEIGIPEDLSSQLMKLAAKVTRETMNGLQSVPGLIDVLGGPTYAQRRLKDGAALMNLTANVLKIISRIGN